MAPLDPFIGRVLDGRFRLEERVGAGGMGAVYRARQLNVDRDVAVKLLHPLVAADPELVRRFENEAKIIARLRDPHTLKLVDFGQADDGQLYLVTEFLEGRPLDDVLEQRGRLPADETLRMLRQICDALSEAHASGVVHRDLKPANLFLERVGQKDLVKVLDFGIARWSSAGGDATTGPLHGTPDYMSPEQARGERVGSASDLYSLGAVAYECLAGVPVFQSETAMGLLLKHLKEPPPPFDQRQPPVEVSQAVEALVMQLLEKDFEDRPESALALADRIDRMLAGDALVTPPMRPAAAPRWPMAVAAVLAGGAAWWWLQPVEAPPPMVNGASPVDAAARPVVDAWVVDGAPVPVALDAGPPIDGGADDAVADVARPDAAPRIRKRRHRPRPDASPPPPPPPPAAADAGLPPGFIRVVPKPG